jgi:hypothetical protein
MTDRRELLLAVGGIHIAAVECNSKSDARAARSLGARIERVRE